MLLLFCMIIVQVELLVWFLINWSSVIAFNTLLVLVLCWLVFSQHKRFWLVFFLFLNNLNLFFLRLLFKQLFIIALIFIIFIGFGFDFILFVPYPFLDLTLAFDFQSFMLFTWFFLGEFWFDWILFHLNNFILTLSHSQR